MFRKCLFILLILFCKLSFSQSKIDSLLSEIERSSDTVKINNLIALSFIYLQSDYENALPLSQEALKLSEKLSFPKGIVNAYYIIGNIYFFRTDYENSLKNYYKAIEICKKENLNYLLSIGYDKIGVTLMTQNKFSEALDYFNLCIEQGYDNSIKTSLNNIANVYLLLSNYSKALEYYFKSLKLSEKSKDSISIAIAYHNISSVYIFQEDFKTAEQFLLKALEIYKNTGKEISQANAYNNIGVVYQKQEFYEKALEKFNKSLEINLKLNKPLNIAQCNLNIAWTYYYLKNFVLSENYLTKAFAFFKEINSLNNIIECYLLKSELLKEKREYKSAITNAFFAFNIADSIDLAEQKLYSSNLIADLYFTLGDFKKAYKFQHTSKVIGDSLFTKEKTQIIENLKISYETSKKEQEIEKLKIEKKYQSRIKTFLFIGIILIGFLSISFFLILTLKIKNQKQKIIISEKEKTHNQLELEKRELENENLKKDLEIKQKELFFNAMNLVKSSEMNAKFIEELITILKYTNEDGIEIINSIINNFKFDNQNENWKEFEIRFSQVHNDFYNKILQEFPDLTPNEVKLCAFLRLNLTTKDISLITYQSINSINQARKRLRKKLLLETEENLITFLTKI